MVPVFLSFTKRWFLPSPGLGGTLERCNWNYWPRRKEDWAHPRMPPPGQAEVSLVSLALDWEFPHGRSCPWTFGHLMGGGLNPPSLRDQSPGCRGSQLEIEPVMMEGHGERSRSCSLVHNSHLGILWCKKRTHVVRLSIRYIKHLQFPQAVYIYTHGSTPT